MRQKFVFLDRDGVINHGFDNGYVDHLSKLRFVPRSLSALRRLHRAGYKVVVISNQAGVSKGLYTRRVLLEVTHEIVERVRKNGGKIDAIYYCPHQSIERCVCRKPKVGLFREARRRFGVRWKETFFIGDSRVDVEAGKAIVCCAFLVLSGRTRKKPDWGIMPDIIRKDLWDAVDWILKKRS